MLNRLKKLSRNILKKEYSFKLLSTFLVKAIVAIGGILLMIVLGQLFGVKGVGLFTLAQTITIGVGGMLSKVGMDYVLMREVSKLRGHPKVLTYLTWSVKRVLLLSVCVTILILVSKDFLEFIFKSNELANILLSIVFAVTPFSISYIMAGFFKGIRKPAIAMIMENGIIPIITVALVGASYYLFDYRDLAVVGWLYSLAAWLVVGYGILKIWKWKKKQVWVNNEESIISKKKFMKSSSNFLALNVTSFFQNKMNILVVGFFLGDYNLGLFRVSLQVGRLINFVLVVLGAVFPPQFAELYYKRKYEALAKLARSSSVIGIIIAFPLLILCFLFPELILKVFGDDFTEAVPILQIIAIAQMINVAMGLVGYVLNMTGYEKLTRNISLINTVFGLILYLTLTPLFGALGAAVALLLILSFQNFAILFFVWKKIGIWMLPMPNLFKLMGIKSNIIR